jgi:carbohydrate kinase (thermoresistant glucokinase family)
VILFIIGPSGCGKTAVGSALAAELGCAFVDADDLHTPEARAKMARSEPLTDADRMPWLGRVRDAARSAATAHPSGSAVVACSALKRAYRDVLREAGRGVRFIALHAREVVLRARVRDRNRAGGHFMPESLVADQVRTWEPPGPEEADARVIDVVGPVDGVVDRVVGILDARG